MVEISSLDTEIQNFGENVCSILNYNNLFERYGEYEKKVHQYGSNVHPFLGRQIASGVDFHVEPIFFPINMPEQTFLPYLILLPAI